jgi:malate dehydrogenase (oxaloacetate-decarboxylating)(NADP+)
MTLSEWLPLRPSTIHGRDESSGLDLETTVTTRNPRPASSAKTHAAFDLLHDPLTNKGTAFTEAERDELGLRGLLPPRVLAIADQERRVLENFDYKPNALERYIFMTALQDRNETLFYRTVINHIERMMPIIYTPTVGEACKQFGHIFRRSRGLYISLRDRGRIAEVVANWPAREVDVIVVTDGERILGLGDLGVNGMGIPIGKLALYTACAGIYPGRCLPVMLDVGTNTESLRADPLYAGLLEPRLRGDEYRALVDEFVDAVTNAFPGVLIQFEDFATQNALSLLARYRDRVTAFNDDIQGTAAVTLAGLIAAARVGGVPLGEQRILFFGAGSAAAGIADLIVGAMVRDGLAEADARGRCWFVDSKGLVVRSRTDLAAHKQPYAHDHEFVRDLASAAQTLRPTTLIGVSAQRGAFTGDVLATLAATNDRPIVFALSNPTSKSECTAEEAYRYTDGRVIFASGSPFDPVELGGRRYVPGQGNNAYIFPGVGLGVVVSKARRVTDEMFHRAAQTLAHLVTDGSLAQGTVYPPLVSIRDVSQAIAIAVAEEAYRSGLATVPAPADLTAATRAAMYEPVYQSNV